MLWPAVHARFLLLWLTCLHAVDDFSVVALTGYPWQLSSKQSLVELVVHLFSQNTARCSHNISLTSARSRTKCSRDLFTIRLGEHAAAINHVIGARVKLLFPCLQVPLVCCTSTVTLVSTLQTVHLQFRMQWIWQCILNTHQLYSYKSIKYGSFLKQLLYQI